MTSNELPPSAEFAPSDELEWLYLTTSQWLLDNDRLTESNAPFGMRGDIPIAEDADSYQVRLPGDRLRSLMPDVAARLGVGSVVEVSFRLAYWAPTPAAEQPYSYNGPRIQYSIMQTPESHLEGVILYVEPTGDGDWQSDKLEFVRDDPLLDATLSEEQRQEIIQDRSDAHLDEGEMGLLKMTRGECADLQQIADSLGWLAD